jgi:hypothetical protein
MHAELLARARLLPAANFYGPDAICGGGGDGRRESQSPRHGGRNQSLGVIAVCYGIDAGLCLS